MNMDLELQEPLSADYSDFGEEFERLMAIEIADAALAHGKQPNGAQPLGGKGGRS